MQPHRDRVRARLRLRPVRTHVPLRPVAPGHHRGPTHRQAFHERFGPALDEGPGGLGRAFTLQTHERAVLPRTAAAPARASSRVARPGIRAFISTTRHLRGQDPETRRPPGGRSSSVLGRVKDGARSGGHRPSVSKLSSSSRANERYGSASGRSPEASSDTRRTLSASSFRPESDRQLPRAFRARR